VLALEGERAEVAVALARAEDEHHGAAASVAAAEQEVAALAETVLGEAEEEGELDPSALERAEREIVRLERRVAAMGPVNALAPEQHEALSARVSGLQRDRADLGAAAGDIRDLTSWLMQQVDERFDAIFGAVSFHFHQLFAELFPGGRATLRLEEPEPADEDESPEARHERRAGVEILAQPPGKRLGALRLLSGGERALTALATILALQQVNPSPFYIFDEVDAALDDTNVMRFVRLLQRLAGMQQFIVVTHNHITMAAADSLWGVTIDSDGVSTVLGVRFQEHVAPGPGGATALPQPVAARAG
jgi:chromosome segregation protein